MSVLVLTALTTIATDPAVNSILDQIVAKIPQ
jgi:hypothetical protein